MTCWPIIIIINNQPTDKVKRPVGWNTMKIGLSSATYLVYMGYFGPLNNWSTRPFALLDFKSLKYKYIFLTTL